MGGSKTFRTSLCSRYYYEEVDKKIEKFHSWLMKFNYRVNVQANERMGGQQQHLLKQELIKNNSLAYIYNL